MRDYWGHSTRILFWNSQLLSVLLCDLFAPIILEKSSQIWQTCMRSISFKYQIFRKLTTIDRLFPLLSCERAPQYGTGYSWEVKFGKLNFKTWFEKCRISKTVSNFDFKAYFLCTLSNQSPKSYLNLIA